LRLSPAWDSDVVPPSARAPRPVLPFEPPDYSPGADVYSLIVIGYANAMFRLGWRYETGHGTARNAEEAVRCYFKAAKLGNPDARARLAPGRQS
jgi:TPR repeat protein